MLHQTFLFLGQLWQLFEVSQILEFLRYVSGYTVIFSTLSPLLVEFTLKPIALRMSKLYGKLLKKRF